MFCLSDILIEGMISSRAIVIITVQLHTTNRLALPYQLLTLQKSQWCFNHMIHWSKICVVSQFKVPTFLCLSMYASVSELYVMFRAIWLHTKADYIKANMPESEFSESFFFYVHKIQHFLCWPNSVNLE